jgi:lipopolysaccharide transport system permease protein
MPTRQRKNKNWSYYGDLVLTLAQKEIKTRYKNSHLSYFWSLLNPLTYTAIFYFAFKVVLKVQTENFILFLVCGLFVWQWISNYISSSTQVFFQNQNLIKKAVFPRFVLPLSSGLQDAFHFVMTLPVIFLAMTYYHVAFSAWILMGLPLLLVLTFAMLYGIGLALGTWNLFFRDLYFIVQIVLQMIFYMTPVLYSADRIPTEYRRYILMNPFAPLVLSWRQLFMEGTLSARLLSYCAAYSLICLMGGILVYRRHVWKFSEVL